MEPIVSGEGDLVLFSVSDLPSRMEAILFTTWLSATQPFTHEWVSYITKDLPARNDRAEIEAVFQALKRSVRYQFHPFGTDRFQTLRRTLTMGMGLPPNDPALLQKWIAASKLGKKTGAGDCDCAEVALDSALHDLGFQVGARIYSQTGDVWGHICPIVWPDRSSDPPRLSNGTVDTSDWLTLELTIGPDGTPDSAEVGYQVPMDQVKYFQDYVFDLAI